MRDQPIKTMLAKAKEQAKQPTVAEGKQQRKGGYGTIKLSRYEQETIVNYNTRDKAVMQKLDTLVADFPDTYKLTRQNEVSKTYSFPKSYVCYRNPREVSTE
ncbi:hypothetical protein IMSAGC011_03302 [Lachnospiraceae bacterium]|nr:hypothetical protein IMSAGC011_03302 [Lachnospiraceae bacterium]